MLDDPSSHLTANCQPASYTRTAFSNGLLSNLLGGATVVVMGVAAVGMAVGFVLGHDLHG